MRTLHTLARLALEAHRRNPKDPGLAPLWERVRLKRALRPAAPEEELWAEALLDHLTEGLTEAWDRYGAPSAALDPEGGHLASFTGPGEPEAFRAPSRREAYRVARRAWFRRILERL
ncbi:hypothetical protein [Thermus filiformis]|uniref:Uncharacterized protein n=2 Tax=Thermus filiformis TaxID=276 RepID=A0A0D6XAP4_THEFI|nr:hypothetical protein [Thermus filiformis]KIX84835.1 hypothetical protein THFILI_00265 [Thermus filiformis]